MPCAVSHAKAHAIRQAVRSLIKNQPDLTLDEVMAKAKDIVGKEFSGLITPEEVIIAINLGTSDALAPDITNTTQVLELLKQQKTKIKRVEDMLNAALGNTRERIPMKHKSLKQLDDLISDLRQLAERQAYSLVDYSDIINKLDNLPLQISALFEASSVEARNALIKGALDNFKAVKAIMKIENLDKSITEAQDKLDKLTGDNPDISVLDDISVGRLFPERFSAEIAQKTNKLRNLREQYHDRLAQIQRRRRAETGINVFGLKFDGAPAVELKNFLLLAQKEGWEVFRTLQFMLDASAFMVQLAPVVLPTITGVNVNYLKAGKGVGKLLTGNIKHARKDFSDAFVNQSLLAEAFMDGFVRVIMSDAPDITKKQAAGVHARKLFLQMTADPVYQRAVKFGLKLSEPRNLGNTEEFFQTNLLNRFPVLGAIRDISEDTMVTTLNIYRINLFKQMLEQNPGATETEMRIMAETVNNLTGTTNSAPKMTAGLAYVMSAPRLMISRLKLASNLARSADLSTTAKQIRAQHTLKMLAGYGAATMLAGLIPGVKPCYDPNSSCFLRILGPNNSYDVTGGVGALFRTIANSYIIAHDFIGDPTATDKDRWDYLINVRGVTSKDQFIRTLVEYKLHPALSSAFQVWEGEDFFSRPFNQSVTGILDPTDPFQSRVEAAVRSLAPISFNQFIESFFLTPESPLSEDMFVFATQFFGINSFRYNDTSRTPKATEYFNSIGGYPQIRYPKIVSGLEDGKNKTFFKQIYKERLGNAVGEIVKQHDYNKDKLSEAQFKRLYAQAKRETTDQFEQEFGDELKKLDKPKSRFK